MRDAFGGTFMMKFLLVFIFLYVAFAAVSLNYAKAFRLKNNLIDFIEENQITDFEEFFSLANGENLDKLNEILSKTNYNKTCINGNGKVNNGDGEPDGYCYNGVLIQPTKKEGHTQYYDVYTYADWNLGALNMLLKLAGESKREPVNGTWKITGEARVVVK